MKTHKILGILLLILIYHEFGYCQKSLTGVVTSASDGAPLPGVNVVLKGSSGIGSITNVNGEYSLNVPKEAKTLIFSFVGMLTKEVDIEGREKIDVVLENEDIGIDEVVITGLGISRSEKSLGYSTSSTIYSRKKTTSKTYSSNDSQLKAGLLTAGEINDFSKWELWKDIAEVELKQYRETWPLIPNDRFTVQLKTKSGMPMIDIKVGLVDEQNNILWISRTDNTGKAELWCNAFEQNKIKDKLRICVYNEADSLDLGVAKKFHQGINNYLFNKQPVPREIDIAFVIDATGSMGDEINYLKTELFDIIDRVKDSLHNASVNLASVFYRDNGDAYLTKVSNFSNDINKTVQFIKSNDAGGGGDFPEAVDEGVFQAINTLEWHESALSRIIFLILDAPPHNNLTVKKRIQEQVKKATEKGIRIIPITCSGIDKSTEYLMRSIALLTNGTYTFLTDHSGIGNPHIKPTTDEFMVEKLNDLIFRLIIQYSSILNLRDLQRVVDDTTLVYKMNKRINIRNGFLFKRFKNKEKTVDLSKNLVYAYYPNPTKGMLTIESFKGIKNLLFCDLSGKVLSKIQLGNKTKAKIDLTRYPVGKYYLCYEEEPNVWKKTTMVLLN